MEGGGGGAGGAGGAGDPASGQPQRPQDVWQLLELAAIHHPDILAVVDCAGGGGGRTLTYAQLFERAAALARALHGAGVRRGDRVGLLSRNSALVIEAHFAAAALHAVVLNLNIHLAAPELAYILSDARPTLVLADAHCAPALLAAQAQLRKGGEAAAEGQASEGPSFGSVVWMQVEGGAEVPPAAEGLQV